MRESGAYPLPFEAARGSCPDMSAVPDYDWVTAGDGGRRFALEYREGFAHVEGVALRTIAEEVGTPTYVYSLSHIGARYRALADSVGARPTSICYAVKANSALAVIRHLARLGAGADIVSGGELLRALAAGIEPGNIVFSGVGKTNDEVDLAIAKGVRSINVESTQELQRVAARAAVAGRPAPVALRVNPDVDPSTHPYLATGLEESKFGIAMVEAEAIALQAHRDSNLELTGLACHIGSQIKDTSPFVDSFARLQELTLALMEAGAELTHLDLGGGFGIAYGPDDEELDVGAWGRAVVDASKTLPLELTIEPGRYLVGNAGVLLTEIIGTKSGAKRSFVIVDAAMNDLIRPSLYEAYHAVVPVQAPAAGAPSDTVDVVGPICESGDFIAQHRPLHRVAPGDHLAVLSAGAYAMTMASNYNTRPMPAEVVVQGDRFSVVRPRQKVEDLLATERFPDW
jgi:diaminopimelate decarboxylase